MAFLYHGFSKDEQSAHHKIVDWVPEGKSVLEIGCATGDTTGQIVKKGCRVTGVEIDPSAANRAKKYCQEIIVGDIENEHTLQKLKSLSFDVLILADVLEHLKNPEGTLKKLTRTLKPLGIVIVSIPNVAFLTNRLKLMIGKFEYTQWGIMDSTHLRFFTHNSIVKLLNSADLEVARFDYVGNFTQLPFYMWKLLPMLAKFKLWKSFEYWFTSLWPQGLAVQFLFICQKVLVNQE